MVSSMLHSWLSQSWWVLLLQALTCGLDPPSTPCAGQRGRVEGGALPDLVRQVELPGQESQGARLRRGRAGGECRREGERGAERVAGGESLGRAEERRIGQGWGESSREPRASRRWIRWIGAVGGEDPWGGKRGRRLAGKGEAVILVRRGKSLRKETTNGEFTVGEGR